MHCMSTELSAFKTNSLNKGFSFDQLQCKAPCESPGVCLKHRVWDFAARHSDSEGLAGEEGESAFLRGCPGDS